MTEDALQHIAKAKRKKSNWLDLTDCGIADSLPEQVAEMVWLEELNLSQNPLTAAVLEAVSKLPKLRRLAFWHDEAAFFGPFRYQSD